ncbi:hypothetical protein HAX54_037375 [Datura stramonium]|uniref:Uncharacterized protein n=1 Tax=Datura stramonium TaxID=4076 RepID=A0ABS8SH67_DATST|nr:hypothetical protein [Datura stramonium]
MKIETFSTTGHTSAASSAAHCHANSTRGATRHSIGAILGARHRPPSATVGARHPIFSAMQCAARQACSNEKYSQVEDDLKKALKLKLMAILTFRQLHYQTLEVQSNVYSKVMAHLMTHQPCDEVSAPPSVIALKDVILMLLEKQRVTVQVTEHHLDDELSGEKWASIFEM